MKKILELDFKKSYSPEKIHEYLANELGFPEYYGKNLDALYECLTEISEETLIRIFEYDPLDYRQNEIMRCIRDAAEDNGCLAIEEGAYRKNED